MNDSFCFIVNTISDRGRAGRSFTQNIATVKNKFPGCRIIRIKENERIDEKAEKVAQECRYIIAVGGDGTAKQVAKGVLGTEAILGVLPMGSGNDFAKSLGMDLPFERALETLRKLNIEHIDIVKADGDLCLNTFGVGIDGLTNYYAETSTIKNGGFRYFFSAAKALFRSPVFQYECVIDGDNLAGKAWMVVVANGTTEGGRYEISPESDNADGTVEVIIVRSVPLMRLLPEFLKLSAGIPFDEHVVVRRTCRTSVSLTLDRSCFAHSDGEIVPSTDNFHFSIQKQMLPVITGIRR